MQISEAREMRKRLQAQEMHVGPVRRGQEAWGGSVGVALAASAIPTVLSAQRLPFPSLAEPTSNNLVLHHGHESLRKSFLSPDILIYVPVPGFLAPPTIEFITLSFNGSLTVFPSYAQADQRLGFC